jgi:biotin transporter BioY
VYTGVIAIWVSSIIAALVLRGSTQQSIGAWVLVAMIAGLTVYYLRGWLRLRAITNEVQGLFDREILPGHYDPTTLGNRLYALKQKGLKVHPHVFALLQLHQHLQSPPAVAAP